MPTARAVPPTTWDTCLALTWTDYLQDPRWRDAVVWLPTYHGPVQVTSVGADTGQAYCAYDNGGFGYSYAVHGGTTLYAQP